jgi:hypothetical protein
LLSNDGTAIEDTTSLGIVDFPSMAYEMGSGRGGLQESGRFVTGTLFKFVG